MIDYKDGWAHCNMILSKWRGRIMPKYNAGQVEHGGMLWRKPMGGPITDEITDLMVYWDVHLEQLADLKNHLVIALDHLYPGDVGHTHVRGALNILLYGNEDGMIEEEKNG